MAKRGVDGHLGGEPGASGVPQLVFRAVLPNKAAGTIIGRGGQNIQRIRDESHSAIHISDTSQGVVERLVTVTGSLQSISQAVAVILAILDGEEATAPAMTDAEPTRELKCLLTNNQVGKVIGKGGATVNDIRTSSGAQVRMDTVAPGQEDRVVTIIGTSPAIVAAQLAIMTLVATMSPDDRAPTPKRQAVDAGYGAPPAYGAPPPAYGAPPPAYGAPPPAYGAPPPAYGARPGPYGAPPAYGGLPPAPGPNTAYGAPPSAAFGAPAFGAPAAYVEVATPGTLIQMVSNDQAGNIIGRGGAGIRELRAATRATVTVATDPEPGTDQRKVTISGSLEDIAVGIGALVSLLGRSR